MPVSLNRAETLVTAKPVNAWSHVGWFVIAGLFVSLLALTYGLDLSPGLF